MTPLIAALIGVAVGAALFWWLQRAKHERMRKQGEDLARVQSVLREYVVQRETADDELRSTADALRQSEAMYRMLAESIDDVVTINDVNGITKYVSPSVVRLSG